MNFQESQIFVWLGYQKIFFRKPYLYCLLKSFLDNLYFDVNKWILNSHGGLSYLLSVFVLLFPFDSFLVHFHHLLSFYFIRHASLGCGY